MQPDETPASDRRPFGLLPDEAVRLRLSLVARTIGDGRPFDTMQMLGWILNGHFYDLTLPLDIKQTLRLEVLNFVVEACGATDCLGTMANPVHAACQLMDWLSAGTIAPIPRHYKVQVEGSPRARRVRVARPPASPLVNTLPEDVLR